MNVKVKEITEKIVTLAYQTPDGDTYDTLAEANGRIKDAVYNQLIHYFKDIKVIKKGIITEEQATQIARYSVYSDSDMDDLFELASALRFWLMKE